MGLMMSSNLRQEKPKLINNMKKKEIDANNLSLEEIKDYVRDHTSGKKYQYDLSEGGMIFVSFPDFVKMIDDGYNIYESDVLSENFISIKYQKEVKRQGKGR